ncbi:hypothetical protein GCG54_00000046 [Colletotrichum gloeosporioides]|uniref:DUF7732 domain-containing protein n=1 Tax=Colletotrichum gloeosporioides TaxID=474922 RepID=A0A8H4CMM2_COLGL|nr:uncharacterized protein GCG54_00000046 [Colletotrichum gloeosporioides]KAF3806680.1 hypothetical protein GCG54_00000046 [Colletotrichum gloeosporioides]
MRVDLTVVALTLLAPVWAAALEPGLHASDVSFLAPVEERDSNANEDEKLWKRKGGGGGGGGRGGGSSSGGSRSGGSSSSGGGSRSGGSSSGGSRSGGSRSGSGSGSGTGSSGSSSGGSSSSRTGGSSSGGRSGSSGASGTGGSARGGSRDSSGGSTKTGSGPAPAYGGSYGGGAKVPYAAGASRGPGSIAPFLLIGGGLAFWPGLWLAGAHMYPYSHPYRFYNQSARENQTKPIMCGCADHQPCACDENNSTEYMNALLGNGSYQGLNQSVVTKGIYNNTDTILINGTLPNGTTASGGSDDVGTTSAAFRAVSEALGFWPMLAVVLVTVFAA